MDRWDLWWFMDVHPGSSPKKWMLNSTNTIGWSYFSYGSFATACLGDPCSSYFGCSSPWWENQKNQNKKCHGNAVQLCLSIVSPDVQMHWPNSSAGDPSSFSVSSVGRKFSCQSSHWCLSNRCLVSTPVKKKLYSWDHHPLFGLKI